MSLFTLDGYAGYVLAAYGASAVILGALIWSTISANARVRRQLEDAERERKK